MANERHITYYIPAGYDVFRSALGRWIGGRIHDRLQAEARFILVVTGLVLTVFAVNYGGWVWFGEDIVVAPLSATAVQYYCVQLLLILGAIAATGIGFSSAVLVELDVEKLTVSRGRSGSVSIAIREIQSARAMNTQLFHRTLRRQDGVEIFINRTPSSIVLVETRCRIIALGLKENEGIDLCDRLVRLRAEDRRLRTVLVA